MRFSKPRVSEHAVELAVIRFAESLGWRFIRKVRWIGRRACPDRMFLRNGQYIWIEFKAPGESLRPDQIREIRRMRQNGAIVHVVDNVLDGEAIFVEASSA